VAHSAGDDKLWAEVSGSGAAYENKFVWKWKTREK